MSLPKIRQNLQVTVVGDELIVYDTNDKNAHCFNAVGKVVFEACEKGRATSEVLSQLSLLAGVTNPEKSLEEALAQFADLGMLVADFSRRDFLATTGTAAGILVASMMAPTPAAAASPDTCVCDSTPYGRWVLHSPTFNEPASSNHTGLGGFVNTQYCIGMNDGSGSRDNYVWIEAEAGGGLTFDETVTFTVTSIDIGWSASGCFSSWENTTCGGCTPAGGSNVMPDALDITSLFPKASGGYVKCGDYRIVATHCNAQGASTVTAFAINRGAALPGGFVVAI